MHQDHGRRSDVRGLAALILMIATTNFFNRFNVSTNQAELVEFGS